jgi:ZIP family zinc transporter
MLLAIFAILPFFSTSLGGLATLRLRHRLHPIMAFAAGALVATALADLLPEAAELIGPEGGYHAGIACLLGFLAFSAMESFVHRATFEHQHAPGQDPALPHAHEQEEEMAAGKAPRSAIGVAGPAALIVHSTLDGLAIGLGFGANPQIGLIVAFAVLVHDFADGINTVTLALAGGRDRRYAVAVLALDAVAPPFGVLLSTIVVPSQAVLGILLAVFSGVFLAAGAGHLLPEAQHQRPAEAPSLLALTTIGALIVVVVRAFIGG